MKVYLGKEGLDESWQKAFKLTMKCKKCGGKARIMFATRESFGEDTFICDSRKNGGKGNYWLHDACAVAVYLCKDCFEPNAIINQA